VSVPEPHRAVQAVAVAAVGVPCVLLGHLIVTGAPAPAAATWLVVAAVLAVAALVPARSAGRVALVAGLGQLAGHAVLAAGPAGEPGAPLGCIPAVGRAASLGLHLAALRTSPTCPADTLAVGPALAAATTAAVVALAIVAGNALVAMLTGVLVAAALATGTLSAVLAGTVGRILARTLRLLQGPLAVVAPARPPVVDRPVVPRRPPTRWTPGVVALRGPPAVAAPAV
jgi:hypothetical protein